MKKFPHNRREGDTGAAQEGSTPALHLALESEPFCGFA